MFPIEFMICSSLLNVVTACVHFFRPCSFVCLSALVCTASTKPTQHALAKFSYTISKNGLRRFVITVQVEKRYTKRSIKENLTEFLRTFN